MIKNLLKLAFFVLIGILVYNYFWGTPEEKASSERIFSEVKDLGRATWDLLKSEKEKFDEGKYDNALQKIGTLFSNLREQAERLNDQEALSKLRELDEKRNRLQERMNEVESQPSDSLNQQERKIIDEDWRDLLRETEDLMERMERQPR